MSKHIGIFMDVSNLYYSIKRSFGNSKLDYGKFLEYFKAVGDITKAVAYGAQIGSQANAFIRKIEKQGFETKYKQPKTFADKKKADWDVGIAIDIVRCLDTLDIVVLGSADSDLAPLVEYARDHGRDVIVMASGISGDLKEVATESIEIYESLLETKGG